MIYSESSVANESNLITTIFVLAGNDSEISNADFSIASASDIGAVALFVGALAGVLAHEVKTNAAMTGFKKSVLMLMVNFFIVILLKNYL
jgi:hypothetical protein